MCECWWRDDQMWIQRHSLPRKVWPCRRQRFSLTPTCQPALCSAHPTGTCRERAVDRQYTYGESNNLIQKGQPREVLLRDNATWKGKAGLGPLTPSKCQGITTLECEDPLVSAGAIQLYYCLVKTGINDTTNGYGHVPIGLEGMEKQFSD